MWASISTISAISTLESEASTASRAIFMISESGCGRDPKYAYAGTIVSSKTPSPSAWRASGESGSRSRRRIVAFAPSKKFPPGLVPGRQHSGWAMPQHPFRTQPRCQPSELTNHSFVPGLHDTLTPGALTKRVSDQARACHPVPRIFRKPAMGLDAVAKHAAACRRASLHAAPAPQPEVRAFDEAIERGRQLCATLGPHELERDVVAVEDRVGRAENARAGVALERADSALVRRSVHPEANEDAVVGGALLLERGIADTHDRHDDSTPLARRRTRERRAPLRPAARATAVTPEPFARQAQRENARASGTAPEWRIFAATIDGLPNGRRRVHQNHGYGNTGPRLCPEALS